LLTDYLNTLTVGDQAHRHQNLTQRMRAAQLALALESLLDLLCRYHPIAQKQCAKPR
jgi:hypothetical protein